MILEMHGNSRILDPCSACADCLYGIPNPSETRDYGYASAILLIEAVQTYAPNFGAAEGFQLSNFSAIQMSDSWTEESSMSSQTVPLNTRTTTLS